MLPRGLNAQIKAARKTNQRGPTGKTGSNGLDGTPGTMIRKADGPPVPDIGNDGDFYIDGLNADWYGPKTGGVWGGVIP